jgi:hypothetical protein
MLATGRSHSPHMATFRLPPSMDMACRLTATENSCEIEGSRDTASCQSQDPGMGIREYADARRFAAETRDHCHQMLRNMHPKEGF